MFPHLREESDSCKKSHFTSQPFMGQRFRRFCVHFVCLDEQEEDD